MQNTVRQSFWKKVNTYKTGTLFVLPFLVLYLVFVVAPIIVAIFLSMTNYNLFQVPDFIGLKNYELLFMGDDVFITAVANTAIFAVVSGPIGLIASFLFAWIINKAPFSKLFALLFYAPSLTSSIAMSVVWMYFFSPDRYGLVNNVLFNLGLINEPILWNTDPSTILLVIIVISIWMNMGSGFMVFLAGLKNTSQELREAGQIDGVRNATQELLYIVLPQLRPQILFGIINAVVNAFGVFDIALVVAGLPSPDYAGHTIVAHLYDYAFIRYEMGYAAAISVVLFLFTFGIGQLAIKFLSSKEG
ncbi:MAG: sugar ABC transporter permease [Clostridia bacterium]|nr:sugar ABC transporter permease [Clostridia bacterium]